MPLQPAKVVVKGSGLLIEASSNHPSGRLFSGGYDATANELFLSSVMGHPGGMAAAGGDPSSANVSGVRMMIVESGDIFWTDDSMSLPLRLTTDAVSAIQLGLESHFHDRRVRHASNLEEIPK